MTNERPLLVSAALVGSLALGCSLVSVDDQPAGYSGATSGATGGSAGAAPGAAGGSGGSSGSGGSGGARRGCNRLIVDGPARDVLVTGPDAWRPKLVGAGDDAVLVLASGTKADGPPSPAAAIEHVAFPAWSDWPLQPLGPAVRLSDVGGDSFLAGPAPDDAFALLFPLDYEAGSPLRSASYHLAQAIAPGAAADAMAPHDVAGLVSIARAAFVGEGLGSVAFGMLDAIGGSLVVARTSGPEQILAVASTSCEDEYYGPEWKPWVADAMETTGGDLLVAFACVPSGSSVRLARVSAGGEVTDLGPVAGIGGQNEVRLVPRPDGGAWLLTQSAVAFQTSIHVTPLDASGTPEAAPSKLVGGVPTFAANSGGIAATALGSGLVTAWIDHGQDASTPIRVLLSSGPAEPIDTTLFASAPGASSHGIGSFSILASPDHTRLLIAWADSTSAAFGRPFSRHVQVARLACAP